MELIATLKHYLVGSKYCPDCKRKKIIYQIINKGLWFGIIYISSLTFYLILKSIFL